MMLNNVSLDISLKCRQARMDYAYKASPGGFFSVGQYKFEVNPTLNLLSGQLGVVYHFKSKRATVFTGGLRCRLYYCPSNSICEILVVTPMCKVKIYSAAILL